MATNSSFGLTTTFGAYAFQNATAPYDAFIVKRMRDAGLIILGKTNLAVKSHNSNIWHAKANLWQELGGFKYGNP